MDHSEAQQSHAVERYLLNEMTGGERDGFEEHYFDCRLCAEEVADGAKLVAAGRRVALNSPNVVPMPRRWTAWVSSAAAAVIAFIAGTGLPLRSSPSIAIIRHNISIDAGTSRANAQHYEIPRGGDTLVSVDVPPDPPFSQYEILIRDSGGRAVTTFPVTAEEAKNPIQLLPRSLPAGSYNLTIEGVKEDGSHAQIAAHEITVR